MDEIRTLAESLTAEVPADGANLTGQTIGDFHILRALGRGGMGFVYLAEQRSLKRKVALKFLRADLAANEQALNRFRREAEAVARVAHSNIVQVYAFGEVGGRHYMALEYVEGRNLGEYMARKGSPDLSVALMIMRQVAAALQRAAESNIVHRDIKPENILLTRRGQVKVADFGLSRDLAGDKDVSLTQTGVTMGTPIYMSPEQIQGESLDARSDIYSLGVTCYHMFAGFPPFRGPNAFEIGWKHLRDEPPNLADIRPDLPPPLVALIHRMLNKDPAARPQSGRDVLRELSQRFLPAADDNPFAGLNAPSSVRMTAPGDVTPRILTRVTPPQSLAPRWAWGVAATVFAVAALGGVGARSWSNARAVARSTDDHPHLPVVSEVERQLLVVNRLYAKATTPNGIGQGAGTYVELGALYWDQKRYDDAEHLFQDVVAQSGGPPIYKTVATYGLAVTFALRDDVEQSNKLFLKAKGQAATVRVPLAPGLLPPEDDATLRYWIVTALDRNWTQIGSLPKNLDEFRRALHRPPHLGPVGGVGP
jgi:serine/threonine-protein kinase